MLEPKPLDYGAAAKCSADRGKLGAVVALANLADDCEVREVHRGGSVRRLAAV